MTTAHQAISPIEPTPDRPSVSAKPVAGWRFWIPMILQLGFAIGLPAQLAVTYYTGRSVVLQTRPVDPFDWLRGYSQTLSYDISQESVLKTLPGWRSIATEQDDKGQPRLPYSRQSFYVVLQQPTPAQPAPAQPTPAARSDRPAAWQPVAISRDRPRDLATNQIALKGEILYGSPRYNLETYYMDEAQRDTLNQSIAALQAVRRDRNKPQPFVVEVRVDGSGQAVAHSLWIGQERYQF
ncbi:MAG: membrane-anchored protein [Oscillatoriales cyanobacterium]|nr:MAG: membrane-anchored protein [Oscillatoriales cyanobacterium]